MDSLTLALADTVANEVIAEARRRTYLPLAVAVLDAGGYPVVIKREDGASLYRTDIAAAKAKGALGRPAPLLHRPVRHERRGHGAVAGRRALARGGGTDHRRGRGQRRHRRCG